MNFHKIFIDKLLIAGVHREQNEVPFILSPTPLRHLLESSASRHWLNSPLSTSSSRPSSPLPTTTGNNQPALSLIRHRFKHRPSYSLVLEQEQRETIVDAGRSDDNVQDAEGTAMGRRWIRWMHKGGINAWVVPGVIAISTLVKFAIGLGSYSGR